MLVETREAFHRTAKTLIARRRTGTGVLSKTYFILARITRYIVSPYTHADSSANRGREVIVINARGPGPLGGHSAWKAINLIGYIGFFRRVDAR